MPLAIETRTSLHQLLLLLLIIVVVCLQNNEAQDDGCSSPNFLRSLLLIMKQVVLLPPPTTTTLLPISVRFTSHSCHYNHHQIAERTTDRPSTGFATTTTYQQDAGERDGVVSLWNKRKQWRGRGGEYSKSLADYFAPLEKNRSTYLRVVCETDSGK